MNISLLSLFAMKSFGGQEKFLDVFLGPFFINYVDLLHHSRVEYPEPTADILLADSGVRSDDIEIAKHGIPHLSPGLDDITIPNLWIVDVALDAKDIIASYLHGIILFGGRLEHDDRSLFNHVVIPEDDLEVLVLLLANDRAGRVDYAALAEYHVAHDLVQAQV